MEQNAIPPESKPPQPPTTAIAEYSETTAALAELRTTRTALEKRRKEIKAPLLEKCLLIDSEAKRITDELLKLEEPIDEAIKAEEKRREEAKAALARAAEQRASVARSVASEIRGTLVALVGASSSEILHSLDRVKLEDYAQRVPQEEGETHHADVEAARQDTVAQLQRMYDATVAQEAVRAQLAAEEARQKAEAERLAKERAEQEARAAEERRRIEAEQQAARERIAAEERAAEQRRKEADAKAAAERERAAKEARAEAEREASKLAAERAKLDEERRLANEKAERERVAAEAKARKEREAAEAKARAEREAAEEKKREQERAELRRMDAYAMLRAFVDRFGSDPEFSEIAKSIVAWSDAQITKSIAHTDAQLAAQHSKNAAKKGKVA